MDGYQEYDDFGNRTRDRNSSEEYATRRSRTRSPSNVERRHRSRSRTGRSSRSGREEEGREGSGPDPLDYEEEEESLRMNDCESSPLYHHHHEDAGGDMNDDTHYYSPSSIDDIRFDNRRNRSKSPVSQGKRSKSIPTRRDSNHEGGRRKYNNNNNSRYADDLKSFTESIIASSTPPTHHRQSVARTHNDRQYKPYHDDEDSIMMEQGTTPTSSQGQHYPPDMAVPVTTGGGVSISSSNYHSDQSQYSSDIYEGGQQQRRVRHKASDICRKFTSQRCYRSNRDDNDDCHSSTIIVKSNNKKRYLWIALSLCSVCIVAAALSVYFLGRTKNGDNPNDNSIHLVVEDTVEPSISIQPSNLPTLHPINNIPTNKPTNHPLSIRDTLIIDYLSSLTKGSSNVIDTPQYLARMWILYDDPLRLHLPYANYGSTSSSSSNSRMSNGGTEEEDYVADWESNVAYRIKQRYALATLYYALHIEEGDMIDHGWLGSSNGVADECEFVEGKNGQQRQAWEGVGCDDEGNVRVLMLGKY